MPAAESFLDLHFPLAGLDLTTAYDRQPNRQVADGQYARTTPVAINVRAYEPGSDRSRGGRRPGVSRYVNARVNVAHSIQDMTGIVLPKSSFAVPGSTIAPGATSAKVVALADASGSTAFTSATLGGTPQLGAFDSDRNAYVAAITSGGALEITKIGFATDTPAVLYQANAATPGTGTTILGLQPFDDVLWALTSHSGTYSVWRIDPATGALIDAAAWLSTMPSLFVPAYMALTDNNLALLGVDDVGLKVYTYATNADPEATPGDPGDGDDALPAGPATWTARGMVADGRGYYYLAGSADYGGGSIVGFLSKVNSAGELQWSVGDTASAGETYYPRGIAYDQVNDRIAIVGTTLLGTTDSFQTRNPSTGAKVTGSQPSTRTDWSRISTDGSGGFRISRPQTTNNVVKLAEDLTVSWTASTGVSPTWVASTAALDQAATDIMRSTRVLRNLVVSGGLLARFTSSAITTINATFLSPDASIVYGQANGLYVYYVDGKTYAKYNAVTDATEAWTATAGSLPTDDAGEIPRLICLWRGRIVLAGLRSDPQNWFMSAVDDPTDFDYSPESLTPTQAVAGNDSPAGLVGDIINTLIPFSDDVLFIGGDHTLWMMTGDPMAGGSIERISDTTGTAFGRPWCKGPDGTIYFFSSRGAIHSLYPGQAPQRLSQSISRPLAQVDVGNSLVRMAWDDAAQGLHVFITPLDSTEDTIHYFWEQRGGWFQLVFADNDLNPKCVYVLDGDASDDRVILFGSWDGYIRQFSNDAEDDDGTPITWKVAIGPLLTPDLDELLLKDVQGILAEDSGAVNYAIHTGHTAEKALVSPPATSGIWGPGRNPSSYIRRAGHAIYVVLSGQSRGAMEAIRCRISGLGKVRRRGR